MDCEATQGQST
jgi:hypothetical protein